MSYPSNIAAYKDVEEAMEQALASKRGVRLTFKTETAAISFLGRANNFRVLKRKQSQKLYAPADPQHGVSPYDTLCLKRQKGAMIVAIEKYPEQPNAEIEVL